MRGRGAFCCSRRNRCTRRGTSWSAGTGPTWSGSTARSVAGGGHFRIDPARLAFAGFSDGGSYALSLGVTNGDVASHVIGCRRAS
jgi:hypothetical protein